MAKPLAPEDDLHGVWPANGAVLAGFHDVKNKGLDIGGKAGDAVLVKGSNSVGLGRLVEHFTRAN